jgi:NAD(P)-dependent dehydrogenase (short-subunit alcohol dehydrogenase family)
MNTPGNAATGGLRERMHALFDLTGKVAIVTGAGRGLGKAIAAGLAGFGAEVVLCGRTQATLEAATEELSAEGAKVWWQTVDVSKEADVVALLAAVRERHARIDVLVNNAGVNPIYRRPEKTTLEDWAGIIDTNLTGVFLCCRHIGGAMVAQGGGGSIINVSSVAGHVGLLKSLPYCAAKGGVELATRALALDWAANNIRVNSIAPAFFETDLTAGLRDHAELSQRLLDQTPLGRFGRAEDMVGAAVYLASAASAYVTGHSLVVDGGWTAR